ncbi:MAG TPA: hypothetical protein VGO79_10220 [Thermoanaerobaculia bacterium]
MGAVAVACLGFVAGYPTVIYDSWGYHYLSEILRTKGLFAWPTDLRTYGYPAFLVVLSGFRSLPAEELRLIAFVVQLAAHLGACAFVAARLRRIYRSESVGVWAYAVGALNPALLIHTSEVLSDLLSAVLVQLAVALCWRLPDSNSSRRRLSPAGSAFLSFLCAGLAVAVRPANAIVALALLGVWLLRGLLFWRFSLGEVLAGALGLLLPLVPQLALNWKVFGRINPLIVHSLYRMQTQWGMGALKYGTVVIPGRSPFLVYANPFYRGDPTPAAFLRNHPLGYLATLGLHVFAMLDFDYPFTFITSLDLWYRWPLALVNFALLAVALAGCGLAVVRLLRRRPIDEAAFAQWSTILVGGAYLAIYAPVEVENRFGLTPEALMTSLIVAVLVWLFRESPGAPARDRARTRSHALAGAAVIAGIAAGVFLSAWISTKQTNPTQPSPANAFVRDPERAPGMARTPSAAQ